MPLSDKIIDCTKLKVVELRAELAKRGLDTKGNKPFLVSRLQQALEDEARATENENEQEETFEESNEPLQANVSVSQTEESALSSEPAEDSALLSDVNQTQLEESGYHQTEDNDVSSHSIIADETSSEVPPIQEDVGSASNLQEPEQESVDTSSQSETNTNRVYEPSSIHLEDSNAQDAIVTVQDEVPPTTEEKDTSAVKNEEKENLISVVNEEKDGLKFEIEKKEETCEDVKMEVDESDKRPWEQNIKDDKLDEPQAKKLKLEDESNTFEEKDQIRDEDTTKDEERDEEKYKDHDGAKTKEEERDEEKYKDRDEDRKYDRRYKSPTKNIEDEPSFDDSSVLLSWYDSDLQVKIDKETFTSATLLHNDGFGFIWAGVRASYGYKNGRIFFEIKVTEHLKTDLEDEPDPNVVRIGWSAQETSLQLGEEPFSYGYGGTGKISCNCKFENYGKSFGLEDVVGCYLNFESEEVEISYAVNGENCGVAFNISKEELQDRALFPHILSKNCAFEVNFGQKEPWFAPDEGFTFAGQIPLEDRVPGPKRPEKKEDCEILMMIGLPGAGKTTWANKWSSEHPEKKFNILGTNALLDKMKVMGLPRRRNYAGRWETLIAKCTRCLNDLLVIAATRRRNYILDQTNVYPSAQKRKLRGFEGFHRRAIIVVPTDEELKSRSDQRKDDEGKDVPDSAVLEMKANFGLPSKGEYFDEVEYIELEEKEAQEVVKQYNKEGEDAGYGNRRRGGGDRRHRSPIPLVDRKRSHRGNDYRDNRNYGGYGDRRSGGWGDNRGYRSPGGGNWRQDSRGQWNSRGRPNDRWSTGNQRGPQGGNWRDSRAGGDYGGGWSRDGGRGRRDDRSSSDNRDKRPNFSANKGLPSRSTFSQDQSSSPNAKQPQNPTTPSQQGQWNQGYGSQQWSSWPSGYNQQWKGYSQGYQQGWSQNWSQWNQYYNQAAYQGQSSQMSGATTPYAAAYGQWGYGYGQPTASVPGSTGNIAPQKKS